jgi:hypothetical protein
VSNPFRAVTASARLKKALAGSSTRSGWYRDHLAVSLMGVTLKETPLPSYRSGLGHRERTRRNGRQVSLGTQGTGDREIREGLTGWRVDSHTKTTKGGGVLTHRQ